MIADKPRPVTGPDGDNPISTGQIRELRETGPRTIDVLNDCDMALAALRGEFGAGRHLADQALARCAAAWNARQGDSK